jgi:hypothetical protein
MLEIVRLGLLSTLNKIGLVDVALQNVDIESVEATP